MAAPLVGCRVVISGLESRPDLNGQTGMAESYRPDTGRYVVSVGSGETIALRPQNVNNVNNADGAPPPYGAAGAAAGQVGGMDPGLVAVIVTAVLVLVLKFRTVTAVFLVGMGFLGYSVTRGDGRVGQQVWSLAGRVSYELQQATGWNVSPMHSLGVLGAVVALVGYLLLGGSSSPPPPNYGGGGYNGGYSGGGYSGGGYSGGGMDFYWLMGAMFLFFQVYRMGGGGRGGWSFDQLWHSLSNMNIWQGMMFLNLLQRVLGGGGRRRRGFF